MVAFTQTMGAVGALCLGVFALTLFFKGLAFLSRLFSRAENTVIKPQSFVAANTLVKVHLAEGHTLDRVTFLGFTKTSVRGQGVHEALPFELSKMAVFQNLDATKIYVRPRAINSIEELPSQSS